MERPLRAKDTEAGKLDIIREIKPLRSWTWTRQATFTEVNDSTKNGVIVQAFLRIAQYIVSAIDALHLYCSPGSCQVRMVASCQLAVGSLYCFAISIYWNA